MIRNLIWVAAIPLVSLVLQHIFMGNVTSVSLTQEDSNKDIDNFTCEDHMQYILMEKVTFVPRTREEYMDYKETKNLKCNHTMLKVTIVLNPVGKKTNIGCFCEKPVAVKKCLEYNENKNVTIIQPKGDAPCNDFSITPCKVKYFSSESYKFFECFEKYGGISSPNENERKINSLKQRELSLKTKIQELNKMLEQREINLTKVIQTQKETIEQRDDKIENLQDENDGLKIYKGFAIVLINCNSGKRPTTGSGDQAAALKNNDQQKQEPFDVDEPELENILLPDNIYQAEDTFELQVGEHLEEDLKMNKPRDKESVDYPV
uniref:Uncharacterized protein n=1 Tax=Magallana gigas TaxID=29159 RepID=A0A8W8JTG0_MAGGI